VNLYRFVGNHPVALTDPSGLDPWWDWRDAGRGLLLVPVLGPLAPVATGLLGSALRPPAPPAVVDGPFPHQPVPFGFGHVPQAPLDQSTVQKLLDEQKDREAQGIPPAPGMLLIKQDDQTITDIFHPGAKYNYRLWYAGSVSGNQATYDANGKLITGGGAAGTPDLFNPEHVVLHLAADVAPFGALQGLPSPWAAYHLCGWAPINHPGAPSNPVGRPSVLQLGVNPYTWSLSFVIGPIAEAVEARLQ
jgi:hypothetical protein